MTPHNHQQALRTEIAYAEDHSAIRWPYWFHLVLWTIVFAAGIAAAAVTGDPDWALLITAGICGLVFALTFLLKNWPVGIRIGDDGIRIGAAGRRARPAGQRPWSDYQRWHELHAPWDAVRRTAVITGRPALRDARSLSRRNSNRIGVLTAPFTRAALLIEVDPRLADVPDFREPDEHVPFFRLGHTTPFEDSPVWYVPTRHPDALRAALAQRQDSPGGFPDPRLPSHLRLLFENSQPG